MYIKKSILPSPLELHSALTSCENSKTKQRNALDNPRGVSEKSQSKCRW